MEKELQTCDVVAVDFDEGTIEIKIPKELMEKGIGFHAGSVDVDLSGITK